MATMHFSPNLGRMAKCTNQEKCPYGHWDSEKMKRMSPVFANGDVRTIRNHYAGIHVAPEVIAPALNQLSSGMSEDLFSHIVSMKEKRDGANAYHMTTMPFKEYSTLKKSGSLPATFPSFSYEILGVGTASSEKTQTWFAVVLSQQLDEWRASLALKKHDLHITLGFTATDLHGVDKSRSTLL